MRSDLRSGLRAKHRGDLEISEQYLQRFVFRSLLNTLVLIHSSPQSMDDREITPYSSLCFRTSTQNLWYRRMSCFRFGGEQ